MKLIATNVGREWTEDGYRLSITCKPTEELDEYLNKLQQSIEKKKSVQLELKQVRQKRSLDANAYCWVLCEEIAKATGSFRNSIYRQAIAEAGKVVFASIQEGDVLKYVEAWNSNGIGWFAEPIVISGGYATMRCFIGTSVYTTEEMSRVIEWLVDEAKNLGIETMDEANIKSLLESGYKV